MPELSSQFARDFQRPTLHRGDNAIRAFTIVEVAMSMFVLALVISTSVTTLQRSFLNLDTARNLATASAILQTELEKERLMNWTTVSSNFQPPLDPIYQGNPDIAGRFALSRSIAFVANHSNQMVQVTLKVTWRTYDRRQVSRTFTTYFTSGGLNDFIYST